MQQSNGLTNYTLGERDQIVTLTPGMFNVSFYDGYDSKNRPDIKYFPRDAAYYTKDGERGTYDIASGDGIRYAMEKDFTNASGLTVGIFVHGNIKGPYVGGVLIDDAAWASLNGRAASIYIISCESGAFLTTVQHISGIANAGVFAASTYVWGFSDGTVRSGSRKGVYYTGSNQLIMKYSGSGQ